MSFLLFFFLTYLVIIVKTISLDTKITISKVKDISVSTCTAIVSDLRANGIKNQTIFVDIPNPFISWYIQYNPNIKPAIQTAYRIVASTTLEKLNGQVYDAWDSTWRNTSNFLQIPYQGIGLMIPSDTIYLQVWIQDGFGNICPPIPTTYLKLIAAPFGYNGFKALNAMWISATNNIPADDCGFYEVDPTPLMRTNFSLNENIQSAYLFVTGLGFINPSINGQSVSDLVLDPAWTTVSARTKYSAFDVQSLLRDGENVLGLVLGKGFYAPLPMRLFGAFNFREFLPVGPVRALASMVITFTDGSRKIISTSSDGSWKVGLGPTLRNNVYLGVEYDKRIENKLIGWNAPGFDAHEWPAAVETMVQNDPVLNSKVELQRAPGIRITRRFNPTSITPVTGKPDSYTISFPENIAGIVSLHNIIAPADSVTKITFAELLGSNGLINPITNLAGSIGRWNGTTWGACATVPAIESDNVTWVGNMPGGEDWSPSFTWHAFQFIQVDGWPTSTHGPPRFENFEAARFHVDNDEFGNHFSTWNPQHAAIDALALGSFRSNWAGGIQSDCPGRERLGYGGDLLTSADAAAYQFDVRNFYSKRVDDYADAAQDNGGLPETAPFVGIATCDSMGGNAGPMQWGSAHSVLALSLRGRYGDEDVIRRNYDTALKWIHLLNTSSIITENQYATLTNGLTDFTQVNAADCPTNSCNCTLITVMGTAFLYQQANTAATLAQIVGKAVDEAAAKVLATLSRAGFLKNFFNASTGKVSVGDLDETLWALSLGLVTAEDQGIGPFAATVKHVADAIIANNTHMYTGAFGTSFLFFDGPLWGLGDLILESLSQIDYPSYGMMLADGSTTLYEHWDARTALDSLNHAWLGSVSSYLRRRLGGISYDNNVAGVGSLIIQPYPPSFNSTAAARQIPGKPIPQRGGPVPPGGNVLPWADTSLQTVRGNVHVNWAYSVNDASSEVSMLLNVTVPGSAKVLVYVPHPINGASVIARSACDAATPATQDTWIELIQKYGSVGAGVWKNGSPFVSSEKKSEDEMMMINAQAGANAWDLYDLSYYAGDCSFSVTSKLQ